MVAFASSVVLVPSAILAWGKPVTFFLLWGRWIAGAAAAFGIGRLAGPLVFCLAVVAGCGMRAFKKRRMKANPSG